MPDGMVGMTPLRPVAAGTVAVRFLRDFADAAGSRLWAAGSECVIDTDSADALVLAGIASRIALRPPD